MWNVGVEGYREPRFSHVGSWVDCDVVTQDMKSKRNNIFWRKDEFTFEMLMG